MQIFVADVTDDYRPSRSRLIKKLKEKNAHVHDCLPPPFRMDLHDSIFNTTLSGCDVSVHILSQYPGRTFEDQGATFIALHQAKAGININNYKVFWVPKDLDFERVDESEYRTFLTTLEFGYDDLIIVKGDPQTLDEDIVNAIKFPHASPARDGILIVHHTKDERAAIRVREQARQRNIHTHYNSSGGSNPSANLRLLTDQLSDVKHAIIVVDKVNYEWAIERAKHILSTLIHMDYKLDWMGFYFSQEAKLFSFDGRFLPVKMLDETERMQDNSSWNTFLQP